MSTCKQFGEDGKEKVIFVTKEDYAAPINTKLAKIEIEDEVGLIKPDGEINWGCPCLGGMATGPCGQEFREAFSCFHYSESELKGSECMDSFRRMSECMAQYPELYPETKESEEDDDENIADFEQTTKDEKVEESKGSKKS